MSPATPVAIYVRHSERTVGVRRRARYWRRVCLWIPPAHFSAPGGRGFHHARGHACGRRGRLPPPEGAPHSRLSGLCHPPTGLLQCRSTAPAPPLSHIQEAVRMRQRKGLRRLAVWTRRLVFVTLRETGLA
jgi:hypothetical protein